MSQHLVATVLIDAALIILAARGLGRVFERCGQPAVIGEIVAGVLLGPTLLGALPGDPSSAIFPAEARQYLSVIGQLGLALFMFIVGLELDVRLLRRRRAVGGISAGAVLLPFGLGLLLAPLLWDHYPPEAGVGRTAFTLFCGVALAITAFPVLARILIDRRLAQTELGALALACAAVNDLVGWIVLAIVLAIVAASGPGDVALALGATTALALFLVFVARPVVGRVLARRGDAAVTPGVLVAGVAAILASAWVTERVGTHAIFGAFLVGAAWPRGAQLVVGEQIRAQVEPVTRQVLLPIFFALPGFSVNLREIDAGGLGLLALILVAAIVGKVIGSAVGGRAAGLRWSSSLTVAALMNTRGLVELIVLNIGLAAGVLAPDLFTLLIVMAVVTTMMTGPLLSWLRPTGALAFVDRVALRPPAPPVPGRRAAGARGEPLE